MKPSEFDLIIEPGRAEKNYWTDLWRFRDLVMLFVRFDFMAKYKQTILWFLHSKLSLLFAQKPSWELPSVNPSGLALCVDISPLVLLIPRSGKERGLELSELIVAIYSLRS